MKPVVLLGVLVLAAVLWSPSASAEPPIGVALNATSSLLWNPQHTYEYAEPCSQYLRTPPNTYANLTYGGGVFVSPATFTYVTPPLAGCVRLHGTDNATQAWVASNFSLAAVGAEFTKNGSLSLEAENLTEQMTLRINAVLPVFPWLVVAHTAIDLGLDGDQDDLAVFQYANYSFSGTCARNTTGSRVTYNLSCLTAAGVRVRLNGTDLASQRLVLTDPSNPPDAIHFALVNTTTEWFYELRPTRTVVAAIKSASKALGAAQTNSWTWADACLVLGDCTCTGWQTTISTLYFLPNGTNQSMSCEPSCADTDGSCTDGSWGGCSVAFQESFSGSAASTLDTGPLEGTATQPAFCGGQSCSVTVTSAQVVTRTLAVVRTNTTNSKLHLRCGGPLPGAPAPSSWSSIYVASPGNPNVTVTWFDEQTNVGNGNESSRLGGNRTCWNVTPASDGRIVNVSLWANFSANGTNSTAFRLIDREQWTNLSNTTTTLCRNVTNALDGAASWANYSWALCANSNTTTGGTTRYGMSCKPLRGPTWYTSGTSMSTMNAAGTFNWFNVTWPNAGAADPCVASGAWTVSTTLTCTNVNITVDSLNITETGSLTLINTTLRSGNVYVTTGALGAGRLSVENTTFDGSQAWWLNGNLTIGGRVNISGVKLYLNGTADGMAGINLTNTGALFIRGNASNLTAGETTAFGYFFWVDSGSTFSIQDTSLFYSGYSGFRYGRGLTINTTAVNFSRVKIYDAGYVGLTILEGANGTNYTATDISRAADATLQIRYAKDLNISQHNSTKSGGGPSLVMDGLILEHANISGNTGDGIGGNGVQNLTLLDVNMTGGSQSGIGLANAKNLTLVSVNITSNAWHGLSGYTLNGVWLHEVNSSGNTQDGIGINYDQLTAKTTSKSNFVRLYNSTVSDALVFQGSVNLTAWNTTTATVTYGTCTICNLTVRWPLSLYLTDDWGGLLKNAKVTLVSRDLRENLTNTTGTAAFIRYVNVTEYARSAASTYVWISNYSVNATQTNYSNRTMSLNVTGPNETTINLTYDPCVVPQDNWTLPVWTIPLANNCEVTHQHRAGTLDSITLSGSGNVTCTDSNFSLGQWNFTGGLSVPRNITIQTGCYWHIGGAGT